jgi:hypothetical protein
VKMNNSQRFFCRYYGNIEYIIDLLSNKHLYHCLPSEFNDPFDCKPLISIKYSSGDDDATWRNLLYYYAKMSDTVHNNCGSSDSELWREADEAFAGGLHRNRSWLNENVIGELKSLGTRIRVCCFAKSARHMMMWAHYANNHRGLVFIFRKSELHDKTSGEFRGRDVTYDSEALKVDDFVRACESYFKDKDYWPMADIIYAKKTKHWAGEDEVRFFSERDRPYLKFNESALYGIVFGAECPECIIRKVLIALDSWRIRPRLFKASILKSTRKLWIERYNEDCGLCQFS